MPDVDASLPAGKERVKDLQNSGQSTDLKGAAWPTKTTMRLDQDAMECIAVIRKEADREATEMRPREAVTFALEETAYRLSAEGEDTARPRDPIAAMGIENSQEDCNCDQS